MAFSLFGLRKGDGETKNKVVELPVDAIVANRYQPRKVFDPAAISELAETIDEHGLLQPIVVRQYKPAHYEIIAGERRWRAVKQLKWEKVPAIVEKMSDKEAASMGLVENLQRSELTSVEEAQAYQQLMELNNLTQSQLAKAMGKSQSSIANKMRLLKLIQPVQNAILDKRISERHGRAMLDLDPDQQRNVLMDIVNDKLTVRQTEDVVAAELGRPLPSKQRAEAAAKKAAAAKLAKQANGDTAERQALDEEARLQENDQEAGQQAAPARSAQAQTSESQAQPQPESSAKSQAGQKPAKKPRKKRKHTKKIAYTGDARLAVNTIKKSVKMVKDTGFAVSETEKEAPDHYEITITIPKK